MAKQFPDSIRVGAAQSWRAILVLMVWVAGSVLASAAVQDRGETTPAEPNPEQEQAQQQEPTPQAPKTGSGDSPQKQDPTPAQDLVKPLIAGEPIELSPDVAAFFEEFNNLLKSGSGRKIAARFSTEALIDSLIERDIISEDLVEDRDEFSKGLRKGLTLTANRLRYLKSDVTKWYQCESIGENRLCLLGQHYDYELSMSTPIRWWIVKEDQNWKIYDIEFVEMSIRITTMASLGIDALVKGRTWPGKLMIVMAGFEQILAGEFEEQDWTQLADHADEALEDDVPVEIRSFLMFVKATLLFQYGDESQEQEALDELNRLEQLPVDVPISHYLRAQIMLYHEDYPAAIQSLNEYARRLGFSADIHENLADAYFGLGKLEQALDHARLGLNDQPQSVGSLASLAACLPDSQFDELTPHFERHQYAEEVLVAVLDWCLKKERKTAAERTFDLLEKHHPESEWIDVYEAQLDESDD